MPYSILHRGFTIWIFFINIMLQKKEEINSVNTLCTINLFKAGFNFNNKLMGRDVMRCAETNKLLLDEQYGSRKEKKCRVINRVTNKRSSYGVDQVTKRYIILSSSDANSCYDRRIHSLVSLALQ